MAPPPGILIVGCGYAGQRVAARLAGRDPVIAIGRQQRPGTVAWDLDTEAPPPATAFDAAGAPAGQCWRALYLVLPPAAGTTDPRLGRFLTGLPVPLERLVYISTTGVYGDAGGAPVTEETPPRPQTDRARRRLDAETRLRTWCEAHGSDWVILRVPGIYGPGRLPLELLRRGDPVPLAATASPGNRIHVDDLAAACVAALLLPQARQRLYNVGDGDHTSTTGFLQLVARRAGLPEPPQLPLAELGSRRSAAALSFLSESRRVATDRIRRELGFSPRFARLADGIDASLGADRTATPRR